MSEEAGATLRCAREGRDILSEALSVLQSDAGRPELSTALGHVAAASSVLYELESGESVRVPLQIRAAMSHLTQALDVLQHTPGCEAADAALESVARAMALLYPIARSNQRQRKRVVVAGLEEADSMPFWPSVPEPLGQPPSQPEFDGGNRRVKERIFLEVDIGLYSDSQFFAGISRDLSDGGVFVATFDPRPIGTPVAIHFVLPSGHAVLAKGVVCWSNTHDGKLPRGMGVAFEQVSREDLEAIQAFCRDRSTLNPPHSNR